VKEALWRRHLSEQRASGLSVRGYCQRHDLREAAFYRWKRTIRERDAECASAPAAIPAIKSAAPAGFAEVVVCEAAAISEASDCEEPSGAGLLVEFPCGARVRLGRGFDGAAFARAARALLDAERC
jgi:hypothetical protein